METDAPTHVCVFCNGTGCKHGDKGLGHGVPACDWCEGLGSRFSDIVLRGHPAFEGRADIIEGCCPVHLEIEHEGRTLLFQRESSPVPPYWSTKENGKQVYRYAADRLEAAFDRAIAFRRNAPDPHQIGTAVIVALQETKDAILCSLRLP